MARMPIPTDWDGETWKCWTVKYPDSQAWQAMLMGLITWPLKGWFWDERTGDILAAMEIGQQIRKNNTPMGESLMTCNEDTLAMFERMALALEALVAKECCPTGGAGSGIFNGGSRGAGITPTPPIGFDEGAEDTSYPPAFESQAAYKAHKCNMANDIVLAFKVDLLSLSNLVPSEGVTTALIAFVTGVLLTPIPYDDIVTLVALLVVAAIEYSFLAQLSSKVQENAEDLICILYKARDEETARTEFLEEVGNLINSIGAPGDVEEWLGDISDAIIGPDAMNKLFQDVPTTTQDADCSECGESPEFEIELFDPLENGDTGTLVRDGTHYTATSSTNGGREAVNFHAIDPDNPATPRCFIISNISIVGATHVFYKDNGYICGSVTFAEFASGSMIDAEGLCFHGFVLQSDPGSPFTVEFDAVAGCE